jgi:tyrosine-protein kinase Etk/Wzc
MESVNQNVEERGEDLFHFLLFRFFPYWPLFLFLFGVSGLAGWLYIKNSVPMYQAYATIMLKDEKKGVDDAEMLEALNIYTTKKIVENEVEVLRSRTLMLKVVKKLHLYAPVYMTGKFRDENLYRYSPITIEARDPDKLTSSPKIPLAFDITKKIVTVDGRAYAAGEWVNTPYGELKFIIDSTKQLKTDRPLYFTVRNPTGYAGALAANTSVTPSNKMSTILYLTFTDESAFRAQDILNEMMKDYTQGTVDEKNQLAANTLYFIEDRLNYLVKELDSIERTIQNYKSRQGIVDLSDQGRLFLNNVGDIDRQVGSINMQLAILDQAEKYVVSKDKSSGIVPSTSGLGDDVLTRLLQKLYDAEVNYEKLRKTMGENNPSVVAIAEEIENTRPAILENIRNQKASLRASKTDIQSTSGQYTSMMKGIPQKERKLVEISREQSIKNGVYTYLLQKREETALSSSSAVPDSKIVDAAVSSWTPVRPNQLYIYVGAFLAAFVLGLIIVVCKEFLSGKILFRSDIEAYTQIPIAAEIARIKGRKKNVVITATNKNFVAEQFRQLRAAIGMYGKSVKKQKILVTSSIPGEGKSFVASNLAVSLSLSGKKVLIVDADFRNPKTTYIFNMEERSGLVEFLEGNSDVNSIIYRSEYNNLWIVPAGGMSNNPTELLLNGSLEEFFKVVEMSFDYIIVDTSPVSPVTDAYVLGHYCEKTLYVVRHGFTPKTMIKVLNENKKLKALNNMFIVFNDVRKRGLIAGGYGFGYGYGYEYVYENRQNNKRTK